MNYFLPSEKVALLLQETAGIVQDIMARHGPGLVAPNGISWAVQRPRLELTFRAWNEHPGFPMSWTIINDVLFELYDFMSRNEFGSCLFVIYDGATLVGRGSIGSQSYRG